MTRAILLVALAALLVGGSVRADESLMLPGNRIKTEDALDKSDTVFVGEITYVGGANLKMPGAAIYFGTQAKVLRMLQGTFRPESTFTLFVAGTMNYVEHPPRVGNSYIIFVRRNTGGLS